MAAMLSTEEAKSFLKSKRYLLSTPNVVSLGFSNEKLDGGKKGRGKIFRAGVIKKLSQESIKHPDIFIPKFFEHAVTGSDEKVAISVKVVEEGEIVATVPEAVKPEGEGVKPLKSAPYQGGSLIRNAGLNFSGCLGVNAQYTGAYRLLSAAHVLTKFDRNYIGNQIQVLDDSQWVDIGATVTDQVDVVLYDSSTVPDPIRARQDLAWANISPDRGSPAIIDIGTPGGIREIRGDEKVKFYAGRTGLVETDVPVDDIYAEIKLKVETPSGATKYAYFEDVCRIEQPILAGSGDSGTAIVAEDDNALLGILFSVNSSFLTAYFCKLQL